jgi:hypothetical protein
MIWDDRRKLKLVIDDLTASVVLLLGSFGRRRKPLLEIMRRQLSSRGYAPVVFDFEEPRDRDLIETVALLAGFSRFVIADLTQPKSTPLESLLIVSQYMVPFAPIIHKQEPPFSMFRALRSKYSWVLEPWRYNSKAHLVQRLHADVIAPCERAHAVLRRRRRDARKGLAGS